MGGNWSQEEAAQSQASPSSTIQKQCEKTPEPGCSVEKTTEVKVPKKSEAVVKRVDVIERSTTPIKIAEKNRIETVGRKVVDVEKTNTNKVPHNFDAILKYVDSSIDKNSKDKLLKELQDGKGILLNQEKWKYWVDKKYNNCFMLYARDLSISWGDDTRFWNWYKQKETCDEIDVAELMCVCWLEMHGKFETNKLSPGVLYEVEFVIMMKEPAYGWDVPVNVRLTLPDGSKEENKVKLKDHKQKGKWMEIPVGEFRTSVGQHGQIEISMYEIDGGQWKKGLVVKGIQIRPKN